MNRFSLAGGPSSRVYRRRGFTLLEMLIVVAIAGVLASVLIPSMRSDGTARLEGAARILSADLQLAQSLSIRHNTEWRVAFDMKNNRYELLHTGAGNPPMPRNPLASAADRGDRYIVELGTPRSDRRADTAVRLDSVRLSNSQSAVAEVTFGPLGGTGPDRNEDTVITIADGHGKSTRQITVTVSWITGQTWLGRPE